MHEKVILANNVDTQIREMSDVCRGQAVDAIDCLRRLVLISKFANLSREIIETEIDGVLINFVADSEKGLIILLVEVKNDDETNVIRLESYARFRANRDFIAARIKRRASHVD